MKEIIGELWSFLDKEHVVCITTNGACNAKNELVMGRGCAKEAKELFPWLPKLLCDQVKRHGNQPILVGPAGHGQILSFPTKHHYSERSNLKLIRKSAEFLRDIANKHQELTFVLPRPGCGNGGRTWEEVKPIISNILPDNVVVISK